MFYTILSIDTSSVEPAPLLSSIMIHQILESYDQARNSVRDVALKVIEEELGRKRAETALKESGTKLKYLEDGLYLLECKDKVDTYDMYQVKTNIVKGYIYNSCTKEVKKVRVFTVVSNDMGMPTINNTINLSNKIAVRGSEQEHGTHVKLIEELRMILERRMKENKGADEACKNLEECMKKKPIKVFDFKPVLDKNASPLKMKENMMKELEFHFKQRESS